jgi:hypothetical protein
LSKETLIEDIAVGSRGNADCELAQNFISSDYKLLEENYIYISLLVLGL